MTLLINYVDAFTPIAKGYDMSSIECVTYGKGDKLDKELIALIKNLSWKHWCIEEGHRVDRLGTHFTFTLKVKLLQIKSSRDGLKLPVYKPAYNELMPMSPDWELISQYYDGVYVSSAATLYLNEEEDDSFIDIGGWSCSTVLVFNATSIYW